MSEIDSARIERTREEVVDGAASPAVAAIWR